MASDGGMLKDSRVKLYLSSRTEMQKIIEETRQQHLAMQAAASGMPNIISGPSAAQQRQFSMGPFAPVAAPVVHINSTGSAPVQRPTPTNSGGGISFHVDPSQGHPGGYDHPIYQQQQQNRPPFNPNQRMMSGQNPGPPSGGFPPHMNQPMQSYPHLSQGHPGQQQQQHFDPRMRGEEPQLGPFGDPMGMGPTGGDMHMYHHVGGERFDRDRGHSRDPPPVEVVDRSREMDRGGYRGRDRSRRDRERDKDRGQEMGRRGRRSRSRSRSGSRGRGRDRRRRSRSDSRERSGRGSRDRDRNSSRSGLLPTPADQMENNQSNETTALETSVQLRLLAGDLTYRDIRDYLNGIHVPNTCIKMINALDGYRFGLAYIRFTSKVDKQKALSRHNGIILHLLLLFSGLIHFC